MNRFLPPWRTLLPAEHGSWFMLGLPMALGLLLRPRPAGAALALGTLALFLARTTFRRVFTGQRDGAQARALVLFLGTGALLLALAVALGGPGALVPLLLAAPLAAVALRADLQRAVRSLAVEFAAQAAFGALAAALVLAGGGDPAQAALAWGFAALVGCANLAHVRRLLGHAHGLPEADLRQRRVPVHALHFLLVAASCALATRPGWAPRAWAAWTALLYLRALVPYRPLPARTLGWREGGLSAIGLLLLWRALAA